MPKFKPKGNIGKAFKNVWIALTILLICLYAIHREASRVHSELWGDVHTLQYLHEGEHGE